MLLINDWERLPSPFFHVMVIVPIIWEAPLSLGSPPKKTPREWITWVSVCVTSGSSFGRQSQGLQLGREENMTEERGKPGKGVAQNNHCWGSTPRGAAWGDINNVPSNCPPESGGNWTLVSWLVRHWLKAVPGEFTASTVASTSTLLCTRGVRSKLPQCWTQGPGREGQRAALEGEAATVCGNAHHRKTQRQAKSLPMVVATATSDPIPCYGQATEFRWFTF